MTPNRDLSAEVLSRLRGAGVATVCLCPGGRNAPFVELLDAEGVPGFEVLDFFEERSASFFALGRARRDRRPVAIVTTSGTAAAELLPAVVEAYYSCTPIVAVTADRPKSYRGTGSPQAIEQPGLFGVYARYSVDLDRAGGEWALPSLAGPCHVNVCFAEPLLEEREAGSGHLEPGSSARSASAPYLSEPGTRSPELHAPHSELGTRHSDLRATRPLIIVGALADDDDRREAIDFCQRVGAPVLAEASSHIRSALAGLGLGVGETAARRGFAGGLFDSVLRLGDVPSFRLWRDLDAGLQVPVVSVSRKPWSGLARGVHLALEPGEPMAGRLPDLPPFPEEERRRVVALDRQVAQLTDRLLEAFPESEPALVRRLSRAVPEGAFVYVGNSQPIREWNRFATTDDRGLVIGENRGANGIDGQLSTFLGWAMDGRDNWAIVGDLTALYDLSAPWAVRHAAGRVRIVILNNGGGKIFERMFGNPRFQNRHAVGFEGFAAQWGLDYRQDLPAAWDSPAGVIELRPDEAGTSRFWAALQAEGGL